MMAIELDLLKAFLAAGETLSFTRAAERLGVSQPRLSLLIRRLEEQLGLRLFVRAHRKVELTAEGERLLDKALAVNGLLREFDDLVSDLRREGRTRLRLGSPRYALEIPERLAFIEDFNIARPSIRLETESDRTLPLLQKLRAGELDLVFATAPFEDTDLETLPFARSGILLAIPEEDEWARADRIPVSAARDKAFATYPDYIGNAYYRSWFGPFAEAGARLFEAHDDHPTSLLSFAARRRFWTVIHPWEGQRLPLDQADRMAVRPIADLPPVGIILLLARLRGAHTTASEAFWSLASERPAAKG